MSKKTKIDPIIYIYNHVKFDKKKCRNLNYSQKFTKNHTTKLDCWNYHPWGFFYAGNQLRAFPNPENSVLTLIQGRQSVYWSENRKNPPKRARWLKMSPCGFFYAENRLRTFPNPENAILTLIQGRKSVYWSDTCWVVQ